MTHPAPVCAAYALAHVAPDLLAGLSEVERFVLPWLSDVWLRPEQRPPPGDWRSWGCVAGRGFGKSTGIALYMNAEIEAGRIVAPALAGPNADRIDEVQIQFLIDTAPPWFRPERYRGSIRWPNGVIAEIHSAETPDSARSSNLDFSWLCELVAWPRATRVEAFNNITTATRVGRAQFVWDTTSRGKNELILLLAALHREDPAAHLMTRGTTFDNPMLTRKYLRAECRKYKGRRAEEELWGRVFAEAAGALWRQDEIDENRRPVAPDALEVVLVAIDPALSASPDADETGIVVGGRGRDGHVYVLRDESGHHGPVGMSQIVVDRCERDAAGFIVERNAGGDFVREAIRSEARTRGLTCEEVPTGKRFPPRRPGVLYYREIVARNTKGTRASGPAGEAAAGRVHLVGDMRELEIELTTFDPGEHGAKSPNRFDAHAYLVTELAGLEHDRPGARGREASRDAERAQAELLRGLAAAARGRGVGL